MGVRGWIRVSLYLPLFAFTSGLTQSNWHQEMRGIIVTRVKLKVILRRRGQSELQITCRGKTARKETESHT